MSNSVFVLDLNSLQAELSGCLYFAMCAAELCGAAESQKDKPRAYGI